MKEPGKLPAHRFKFGDDPKQKKLGKGPTKKKYRGQESSEDSKDPKKHRRSIKPQEDSSGDDEEKRVQNKPRRKRKERKTGDSEGLEDDDLSDSSEV